MKKVLLLAGALALVASSAFAQGGIDLSLGGCPNNAGVSGGDFSSVATAACGSGSPITIFATFQPNENIPDLVALDGTMDAQVGGDLTTNGFWNFDAAGCNNAALGNSHTRPAGCTSPAYTSTWNLSGAGEGILCVNRGPAIERIVFSCFRPGILAVTAGQKLFGTVITIDGSTATESGGSCSGCSAPFFLVWNIARPGSNGSVQPADLGSSGGAQAGVGPQLYANGGNALCCAVPTKKHTWGQLKSLYR